MKLNTAIYAAVDDNDKLMLSPQGEEILEETSQGVDEKLRAWKLRGMVKKVIMVPYNDFSDLVHEVEESSAA